jgi:predicted nucleic acid-binding protein
MTYVIDSSVAFKWVVAEIDQDKAIRLRDGYRRGDDELHAPDIFPAEIANALLMAQRRSRISDHAPLLFDVLTTCPQLHLTIPLLARLSAIVSTVKVTIYDGLYVVLAETMGCEFVTADDKLVKNLRPQFPFIVPLSSLP